MSQQPLTAEQRAAYKTQGAGRDDEANDLASAIESLASSEPSMSLEQFRISNELAAESTT